MANMLAFRWPKMVQRLESLVGGQLPSHHGDEAATARLIMERLFRRRRVYEDPDSS